MSSKSPLAKKLNAGKKPAAQGFKPGSRDKVEAMHNASLIDYSNGLGGSDPYLFRDAVGVEQDDDDVDLTEASFAKMKRVGAVKATAALKKKLTDVQGLRTP
ncbi:hypothetical protein F442_22899 [Phytophthora nicotianae P10297]|uniref:Uncharacterized protein n=2 Tax=Phytophthora nicotianae TaxID=4792 RepID=W2XZ97_PHYNI|nr:hypothetical protein F444_22321 [Phytophthora nicotianae P1976]ETP27817.1 hypothetical protein F442_22899 [Phytophthora nicotianae P10297]